MDVQKCPLCGNSKCKVADTIDYYSIKCETYKTTINIFRELVEDYLNSAMWAKSMNLIVETIIKAPAGPNRTYWSFYIDDTETVKPANPAFYNLANDIKSYPVSVSEIANRSLLNLVQRYPKYGALFGVEPDELRLYFSDSVDDDSEAYGIARILADFGYIKADNYNTSSVRYMITAEGWKKVDVLNKEYSEIKQGFIAMQFGGETATIREAFRSAIRLAGYTEQIIDEKQHNNQIVPEIFYEIKRSKFVVVDVTYPNYGAYYEAGYAQGLGKEVIVCCKKEAFESAEKKPHFDISQKSMVVWENESDLVSKLHRRIEATVN